VNYDKRIIAVSLARGIEMFSISILVIIIPLFIASDQIITENITNKTVYGFPLSKEFIIGVALSISIFVSAFLTPIIGKLSDKIQKRKLFIITGLVLLTVSMPLYLYIESYYSILGLRILQGISGALIAPVALAMVNEYSRETDTRGEGFGYYNSIRLIGFAIGPIFAGVIISNGPYNLYDITISGIDASFYIIILFIIISLLIFNYYISEPKRKTNNQNKKLSKKDVIFTKQFIIVLLFAFSTFWLSASINMFATLENTINTRFDQSTLWFSIQFSVALLANIITQVPVGKASDNKNKTMLILIGFIILIPTITLQGFAQSSLQMLILRLLQGMSVALVYIPSLTYVGEVSTTNNSGFYLSFMSASFALGLAIGPIVSGILYTVDGFYLPFVFAGLFSTIGFITIYYITRKIKV